MDASLAQEDRSCVHGLRNQARCVASLHGHCVDDDNEHARFAVGTLGLQANSSNELHIVQYNEDQKLLHHIAYLHDHEIWDVAPCPVDKRLICTSYNVVANGAQQMNSTLWRMSAESTDIVSNSGSTGLALESVFSLNTSSERASRWQKVLWDPSATGHETVTKLVVVDRSSIRVFSIAENLSAAVLGASIPVGSHRIDTTTDIRILATGWNPHNISQIAVTYGTTFEMYDLRTNKSCTTLVNTHAIATRTFDFNYNKPYQIATGGEDCIIRIWDIRGGTSATTPSPSNTISPILEIPQLHTHWITALSYNKFHDQLLLSGSSDSQLNLISVASVSSAPLRGHTFTDDELDDEPHNVKTSNSRTEKEPLKDGLIACYEQHEDSIYSVAWSWADPWVFASVDYGGRLLVNVVPKEPKYKILL